MPESFPGQLAVRIPSVYPGYVARAKAYRHTCGTAGGRELELDNAQASPLSANTRLPWLLM